MNSIEYYLRNHITYSEDGKTLIHCFSYDQSALVVPNNVTKIGNYAFCGCKRLTSIKIPNSVTEIGQNAFSDCKGLTYIEIPNSVTEIGKGAFSGCTGLTSIEIPNNVTKIGDAAFYGCTGLTSINIPNNVTKICRATFEHTGQQLGIYVTKDNSAYCDIDGTLFTKDQKILLHYHKIKGQTEYTIPNNVRRIESCSFEFIELKEIITDKKITDNISKTTKITYLFQTIKQIKQIVFKNAHLQKLHINCEDPYQIDVADDSFKGMTSRCTLYVPIGTGYAYRHHPVFGKFKEVKIEK